MLKNFLKIGFRNLAKNRLSSLINILGLGLAVGCSLVVFEFLDWSMHLDNFHAKINRLFVVERIAENNGSPQYYGNTPAPLGPLLKQDFPQIENIARASFRGAIIQQNENVFKESVTFVDDAFYQMFDFPVGAGNKQQFTEQDAIVLTQELSKKLFGRANAIGKTVSLRFNQNRQEKTALFTVKGVLSKLPVETSFYFSALVPYRRLAALGLNAADDWSQMVDITFVQANNEEALLPAPSQTKKYLTLNNKANQQDKISSFHFQPLEKMIFHAYQVSNSRFNATKPIGFILLTVIGVSILLLVYFNYMNMAIASAGTRLKEIGVRKVLGSNRRQIISQFILENLILCTIGVLIGLLLANYVFLPLFSQVANIELGQKLFTNYRTWVALLGLILVSALSGAAYPSLYISAFKPIKVLKGKESVGGNTRFRTALLGFQFLLTFLAVSMAVAFMKETRQAKARPWGYEPTNNVVTVLDQSSNFEVFRAELENSGKVKSVSGSVQSLGNFSKQLVINLAGQEQTVQSLEVLPGFASQMGMDILRGRDLSTAFKTDQTASVLVNQAFLKQMGWASGIGRTIQSGNQKYTVVGEVKDFHFENFQSPIGPLVLRGCRPAEVKFAYVKTKPDLLAKAHTEVEKVWKKVNPAIPFDYYYQDLVFESYFLGFAQVSQVLGGASLIIILISIFGIFGLALLILGKKMKEVSIRKVLGASMGNLSFLINKDFLWAIGLASLLGFPLSYWLTSILFNQISSESQVSFSPLVLSFLTLFLMTVLSVSWHLFRVYTANPTEYLRDE